MTLKKKKRIEPLDKGSDYYTCTMYTCTCTNSMYTKEWQLQFKNIKGNVNDVIYFSKRLTTYAWNKFEKPFLKIILKVKCWNKNEKKNTRKNERIEYDKNLPLDVQTSILIIL